MKILIMATRKGECSIQLAGNRRAQSSHRQKPSHSQKWRGHIALLTHDSPAENSFDFHKQELPSPRIEATVGRKLSHWLP